MKILQVISYFYPAWAYGGVVKVAYEISKQLVDKGHKVTVWTTDVYDKKRRLDVDKDDAVNIKGIRTYYFRNISNILAANYNFFFAPKILSIAKREVSKFDVIHLHEYYAFQNIIVCHYARRCNVPYLLSVHGSFSPACRRQKSVAKKIFTYLFGKYILRNVSRAIALTKEEKRQFVIMGIPENKIKIIPKGIYLSEFKNLPPRGVFRKRYSIPQNAKVILFLGRIHKIKGLDLLIKAFYKLTKEMNNIKLVIVGPDGGYLSNLNRLIRTLRLKEKVLLTGGIYQKEKLSAYVGADVFVLSSYSEVFPITVLEACAVGTPVVITDKCNASEVEDYQAGFVVKCDEKEIKEALYKILSNKNLRKKLGENGKRMIKEKFTWDKIIGQVEDVYEEVSKK